MREVFEMLMEMCQENIRMRYWYLGYPPPIENAERLALSGTIRKMWGLK